MTATPRQAQLEAILDLSAAMLEKAQTGEWVEVAAMEEDRRRRLTEFFAVDTTREDAPGLADCIRRMLDINAQLMELGGKVRQQAAGELSNLDLGRRASEAYNQNR
jgi:hypothetical protein